MEERKIMIEVTQEEYNKIIGGALDDKPNESVLNLTNEQLQYILLRKCIDKNVRVQQDRISMKSYDITSGTIIFDDKTSLEFILKKINREM